MVIALGLALVLSLIQLAMIGAVSYLILAGKLVKKPGTPLRVIKGGKK